MRALIYSYANAASTVQVAYADAVAQQTRALSANPVDARGESTAIDAQAKARDALNSVAAQFASDLAQLEAELDTAATQATADTRTASALAVLGALATLEAYTYGPFVPIKPGADRFNLMLNPELHTISDDLTLVHTLEMMGPGEAAVTVVGYDKDGHPLVKLDLPGINPTKGLGTPNGLLTVSGGVAVFTSTYENAIHKMLIDLGVPKGARILMVGHSQAGDAEFDLANSNIGGDYQVVGLVTAGSPVNRLPSPPGVDVVSLANRLDPVANLNGDPDAPAHPTLTYSADYAGVTTDGNPFTNHDSGDYADAAASPLIANSPLVAGFTSKYSAFFPSGPQNTYVVRLFNDEPSALVLDTFAPPMPKIVIQPPALSR